MIDSRYNLRFTLSLMAVLSASMLAFARVAAACPVCFGDPNSDMAKSAVIGMAFLAVVIVGVLIGVASLATCWSIRARRLQDDDEIDSASGTRQPDTGPRQPTE